MGQADQGGLPLEQLKQKAVEYAHTHRSTQGAQQRKLPEEVRERFQSLSNHLQEAMGMRPTEARRAAAREIARDQDMPEHVRGYFRVYASSPQNPEESAGKALDRAYRQGNWGLEQERAGGEWGEGGFPDKRDAYRYAASNLARNEDLPEAHRKFYRRLNDRLEGTEGRTSSYGPDTETAIAQAASPPASDKFQQALDAAGERSSRLRQKYALAARRMMQNEGLTQEEKGFYKNLYGRLAEDIKKNPLRQFKTVDRADSRALRMFNETKKQYGAEKAQKSNYGAKESDPFDIDVSQDEEADEGSADTQARGQETPPSVQSVQSDMGRSPQEVARGQGPETVTLGELQESQKSPGQRLAQTSEDNPIDRAIKERSRQFAESGPGGGGQPEEEISDEEGGNGQPEGGRGGEGIGRSTYKLTEDMSGQEKYRAIRESVEANNPNASRQRVHQVALALMATDPNVSDNARANAQRYANQMRQGHSPEEAQERAGVATEDVRKAYTRAWNKLKGDEEFRRGDRQKRNRMIAEQIIKDPNASIGAVDFFKNRRRPASGQARQQQSISDLQRQAQKLRQKHKNVDTEEVESTVQDYRKDMRGELQDVQEKMNKARYRAASGAFANPKAYRTYMQGLRQKANRIRQNYQQKIQGAQKKLTGNLDQGINLAYSEGKGRASYVDPLTGERKVIGKGRQWGSQEELRQAAENQYKSRLRQAKKTWGGDTGQKHKYVGLNHNHMYMPDYQPGDAAKETAKAQAGSSGGGWSWSDNPVTNTFTGIFG